MGHSMIQYILYIGITVLLAIPLGRYIGKVMNGEKVFLSKLLVPCEKGIYRLLKINHEEEMTWRKYASSVVWVSVIGVFVLMLQELCYMCYFHYPLCYPLYWCHRA